MLLALLSLTASPTLVPVPADAAPTKACQTAEVREAAGQPGRFVPLGSLPRGSLFLTVDRRIDRCMVPVTVSTTIPAANGVEPR